MPTCATEIVPLTLAERERRREIASYFAAASVSLVPQAARTRVQPKISPDRILTALTQLGAIRMNSDRAFVSLIDGNNQYIIAEATKTVSLLDSEICGPGDQVYLGTQQLEIAWGVCPNTMRVFTDNTGNLAINTPNITADTSRYIIRDFQADPQYRERPYVKGWPHMRCYVEVPLTSSKGYVIGSYCIVDNRLREDLDDECVRILTETSMAIMEHLDNMKARENHARANQLVEGLGLFMDGNTCLNSTARMHRRQRKGFMRVCTPDDPTTKIPLGDSQTHTLSVPSTFQVPEKSPSLLSSSDGFGITCAPITVPNNSGAGYFSSKKVSTTSSTASGTVPDNPFSCRPTEKTSVSIEKSPIPKEPRTTTKPTQPKPPRKQSNVAPDVQNILGLAGSLIRDSMGLAGVMFLDAHPTHRKPAAVLEPPSAQELAATPPADDPTEPSTEEQLNCAILGLSLSAEAANAEMEDINLPERMLQRMVDLYPVGKIFHNEETLQMASDAVLDGPSENKRPHQVADVTKLFDTFEGSRSIIFFPLWDVQRDGFFAAAIAWTSDFGRLFESTDLTYLSAFGNSIMAEVARVEVITTSRAKSDFISSLSHELRSPLHGILASSELLRDALGPFPKDHTLEIVSMIESCGNTLLDTLTNLLDFAKINSLLKHKPGTADEKKPQHVDVRLSMKQNVDLSVLVQDVVEGVYVGFVSSTSHDMDLASQNWTHSSNPSSSEISVSELPLVTVNIERRSSWVLDLDVGAWKRIVMNLAGNSIKYTPNGHIEVNLRTEGMRDETGAINAICFEVVDTGIGMSPEYQENHLFKPFAQENSLSVGTGLGLSIVHQIVAGLKGRIEVKSEAGVGTRIKILVPLPEPSSSGNAELPVSLVTTSFQVNERIKGRRVCVVLPPGAPSSQNGTGSLDTISRAVSIRKAFSTLLGEWFGMDVSFETKIGATDADLYITEEATLNSLAQSSVTIRPGHGTQKPVPLLVLYSKLNRAQQPITANRQKVTYMRYPVGPKKLAAFFNNVFGTRVTVEHLPNVTSLYAVLADQVSAVVDVSKVEEITAELPIEQLKTEVNVPKLERAMFEVRVTDTTSQIPTEVSPAPKEPPRQHVLCVDDNSINLKLITTTVMKLGYTCVTTMNGLEAFNAYKATTKPFTCVFMDINMPVMDGFASTRHIREYERANQLPRCQIVALTGLGSATSQQEALDCGVDMFLTKPVQMKTLRGILCHVAQPPKENG